MEIFMDPTVSALIGAGIGALSSVVTMIVQAWMKDKRERSKQLIDVSIAQYKAHAEHPGAKGPLLPLITYLHHNDLVLKAIEDGSLSSAKLMLRQKRSKPFF